MGAEIYNRFVVGALSSTHLCKVGLVGVGGLGGQITTAIKAFQLPNVVMTSGLSALRAEKAELRSELRHAKRIQISMSGYDVDVVTQMSAAVRPTAQLLALMADIAEQVTVRRIDHRLLAAAIRTIKKRLGVLARAVHWIVRRGGHSYVPRSTFLVEIEWHLNNGCHPPEQSKSFRVLQSFCPGCA